MSRTSTFWLRCALSVVPSSSCMSFKQSSLHSVPFTDITLFRDENYPVKPSCTALLNFAPDQHTYATIGTYTVTAGFLPAMNFYFTDAGQMILCCRKFIVFQYNHLWFEQPFRRTIAQTLAEYRLFKFSFGALQKYCILSLLHVSLCRFSQGKLINISSKKNAFVQVFTLTIRHFETRLFQKSGKIRQCQAPARYEIWQQRTNFASPLGPSLYRVSMALQSDFT